MNTLSNISVVLVKPTFPKNVGLVCRVMKNFGVTKLILVNPTDDVREVGKVTATHSEDLLEEAIHVESLEEALRGVKEAWGFTVRSGKLRRELEPLPEIKEVSFDREIALVFGPERTGLKNEDLSLCSKLVTIPTGDEFHSLNISHAVTLSLYHLFTRSFRDGREERDVSDMNLRHQLSEQLISIMQSVEDGKARDDATFIRLRALLNSIELTTEDMNILLSVTGKIRGAF